jgi:hypothetical protein
MQITLPSIALTERETRTQVYQLSIGAACRLTWPADRLIVQVLDDSTDPIIKVRFFTHSRSDSTPKRTGSTISSRTVQEGCRCLFVCMLHLIRMTTKWLLAEEIDANLTLLVLIRSW